MAFYTEDYEAEQYQVIVLKIFEYEAFELS